MRLIRKPTVDVGSGGTGRENVKSHDCGTTRYIVTSHLWYDIRIVIQETGEMSNERSREDAEMADGNMPDVDTEVENKARKRGRPKRLSDAEQARAIARKAKRLFYEKGYGPTTMDDIVKRCHISKTTLYRLFPGKTDVFAAIIDDHRHSMLEIPTEDSGLPLEEALARIFHIEIDEEADEERMALIRFERMESQEFPELHALLCRHGPDQSRRELAEWLDRQKAKGLVSFSNAGDVAQALMDLVFGAVIMRAGKDHQRPDRAERIQYLKNCLSLVVNGLTPRDHGEPRAPKVAAIPTRKGKSCTP